MPTKSVQKIIHGLEDNEASPTETRLRRELLQVKLRYETLTEKYQKALETVELERRTAQTAQVQLGQALLRLKELEKAAAPDLVGRAPVVVA